MLLGVGKRACPGRGLSLPVGDRAQGICFHTQARLARTAASLPGRTAKRTAMPELMHIMIVSNHEAGPDLAPPALAFLLR